MTARTVKERLTEAPYNLIEEFANGTVRKKIFLANDALTNYVQSESWQICDIPARIKYADAGEFSTDEQFKTVFSKYAAWFMLIK